MSAGYFLSPTETGDSAKFVEVADSPLMGVKLSVSSGELFCKCKVFTEGKNMPFWTKVIIPLASSSEEKTAGGVLEEIHLPIIAGCAGLSANGVHLACKSKPGSPSTPATTSMLLKVRQSTAVKLVSGGGGVNPGSVECEMNADGLITLDGNWRGMEEHRSEWEWEGEDGETAVLLVDLEKLRLWNSCYLQHSATIQLLTDLLHKSLRFLQVFSVNFDSCVGYVDSVFSLLPLLVSFQPSVNLSKLPPNYHSANTTRAEGRVDNTLLRMTREADAVSSLPLTVHVSIVENCPVHAVVATVQTQQEGLVSYSLVSGSLLFEIDGSTGVIRTKG